MLKIEKAKQLIKQLLLALQRALIKAQLLLALRRYARQQTANNQKEVFFCHDRYLRIVGKYRDTVIRTGQVTIPGLGITRHLRKGMGKPALTVDKLPEGFYVPYWV